MPILRGVSAALAVACLAILPVSAADNGGFDCSLAPCRAARTFEMQFHGDRLRAAIPASPYLTSESHIVIFPEETLVFRFPDAVAAAPGKPQFVRAEANGAAGHPLKDEPPGTLVLTYGPSTAGDGMTLTLQHNLPGTLKLKAFMSVPRADGPVLQYTST